MMIDDDDGDGGGGGVDNDDDHDIYHSSLSFSSFYSSCKGVISHTNCDN